LAQTQFQLALKSTLQFIGATSLTGQAGGVYGFAPSRLAAYGPGCVQRFRPAFLSIYTVPRLGHKMRLKPVNH